MCTARGRLVHKLVGRQTATPADINAPTVHVMWAHAVITESTPPLTATTIAITIDIASIAVFVVVVIAAIAAIIVNTTTVIS